MIPISLQIVKHSKLRTLKRKELKRDEIKKGIKEGITKRVAGL
jgi:hypothetical protein